MTSSQPLDLNVQGISSTITKEHALSIMQMHYTQSHWCKQFPTWQ